MTLRKIRSGDIVIAEFFFPHGRTTNLKKPSKFQARSVFTIPRKYILGYCGVLSQSFRTLLLKELASALDF